MIRAIVHLLSEQPVTADLLEMPKPGDALLVCTNLRTLDGKRPVFIDQTASTFILPYLHIRFIEIPPERPTEATGEAATAAGGAASDAAPEADLEIDEDFLRRIREA
ncbi:MAG: hypothetical protein L0227_14990 [Chloroflexi bacterium]|nr:hypothetical protein [Chloroflexota bacterium]